MIFSQEQEETIRNGVKNILVTARAGSGKTLVLVERVKRLLETGLTPEEIIIFAFNVDAVAEINKRLEFKIAKTFHSFSNQFADLKINSCGNIFDEMVIEASEKIPKYFANKIKHILIDEFQDFNPLFYSVVKRLLTLNPKINIFAVGDDWQAIYGFTGASLEYFTDFETYFPKAKRLYLLKNYRSKKAIVDFANSQMIGKGKPGQSILKGGIVSNKYDVKEIEDIIKNNQNKTIAVIAMTNQKIWELKLALEDLPHRNLFFSTAHSAKGLEFDIVILDEVSFFKKGEIFYVASTRAKESLYIFQGQIYSNKNTNFLNLSSEILVKLLFLFLKLAPNKRLFNLMINRHGLLDSVIRKELFYIHSLKIQSTINQIKNMNFTNLKLKDIELLTKIRDDLNIFLKSYDLLEIQNKWSFANLTIDNTIKYLPINK